MPSSVATAGGQYDFEEESPGPAVGSNPETSEPSFCATGGASSDLMSTEEEGGGGGAGGGGIGTEPMAVSSEALKSEVIDQLYFGHEDPSAAVVAVAAAAAAAAAVASVPACDFPLALRKSDAPLSLCAKAPSGPLLSDVAEAMMESAGVGGGGGSGESRLRCHTCDTSFTELVTFEQHVRSHELDKKCMKCFHCGKTFASYSNLKRHKKIHTGVRPHVCAFCARPFLNRSDLVRHWRIHTGERPYRCEVCQHAFKYSFNLKTHQQKYHSHVATSLALETTKEEALAIHYEMASKSLHPC